MEERGKSYMNNKKIVVGIIFGALIIMYKLKPSRKIGLCSQEVEYRLENGIPIE